MGNINEKEKKHNQAIIIYLDKINTLKKIVLKGTHFTPKLADHFKLEISSQNH